MLYPSMYNISLPKGSDLLLFNTKSLYLGRVDRDAYYKAIDFIEELNNGQMNSVDDSVKQVAFQLRQRGFLVPDQHEEKEEIVARFQRQKSQNTHMGLTIAPTENCNFACPYCYESTNSTVMTEETQDALLEHIEREFHLGVLSSMHITWYGGEPLMPRSFKAIKRMSSRIIQLCEKFKIDYSSNIITNGYLLYEDVSRQLAECQVELVQITLDGPRDLHNKTRILKNGQGSFDQILANIKAGKPYLRFSIRMNVDADNADGVSDLKVLLKKEGVLNDAGRVALYISPVRSYTSSCKSSHCLSNNEFYRLQLDLLMKGINDDGFFVVDDYPQEKQSVCTAVGKDSFVIGPDGSLYKCWLDLGQRELSVGAVEKDCLKLNDNLDRWTSFSPFEKGCSDCTMLPVCMGGCPELNMRSDGQAENEACCNWKYVLKDHLSYIVDARQKNCGVQSPVDSGG
ncbi:MAG: radical SAM protein [Sedimenticola sp.]